MTQQQCAAILQHEIAYVVWKDAMYSQTEISIEDLGLVVLHCVGFVVRETEEFITLSVERQEDNLNYTRTNITIPKSGIVSISRSALSKAFRQPRRIKGH